jgi:hypothetical protein
MSDPSTHVARELHRRYGRVFGPAKGPGGYDDDLVRHVEDTIAVLRQDAPRRVLRALMDPLGEGAWGRYQTEPLFHAAVDAICQIAGYAVLEELPLTDAERTVRRQQLDLLIDHLGAPMLDPKGQRP